jgi:hypothetical protein
MKPGSLINVDDTDHKSQKPKAKSQEPRAQSQEPKAKSQKPKSSFHQINAWPHSRAENLRLEIS